MSKKRTVSAGPLLEYVAQHPGCVAGWSMMGRRKCAALRCLREGEKTETMDPMDVDEICSLLEMHMSLIYGDEYNSIDLND